MTDKFVTKIERWSPSEISISEHKRIILEIGPGRGDFLFHLAITHPTSLIVAVELKHKRFGKLVERVKKRGFTNILLVKDYAQNVKDHLPQGSIDEVHIQFPDPWPKRRHEWLRLVSIDFLRSISELMKPGARINFTTDHKEYADKVLEIFRATPLFKPALSPALQVDPPDIFPTYFFDKWKKMEKHFYYQAYHTT